MPTFDPRPVLDAILAMLRTLGRPVGDHESPADTSDRYMVLWGITGGMVDGAEGQPHEQGVVVVQVDSSGHSRQQAQWVAYRVARAMVERTPDGGWTHPIAVPGWSVSYREWQVVGQAEPEGQDETGNQLFTVKDRYEITVVRG
jgi:hypothetical protein